jgi:hypothetical protein
MAGVDVDAKKLWMEDLIRTCIKPRLANVGIHVVPLANSNVVFIVRVPRSWNGPHVVEFKRHWRFYSRHSAGNYPLDVDQLRDAYIFGNTLLERLEEFRYDRLAKIAANDSLDQCAKFVLHLQPFDSVRPGAQVDIFRARANPELLLMSDFTDVQYSASDTRLNFDGLFAFLQRNIGRGYLQIFRTGAVEEVEAQILSKTDEGKLLIPSLEFERSILSATGRRLALLKHLGVSSPVLVHLSLLGVRGYTMELQHNGGHIGLSPYRALAAANPIDRDDLLLGGIVVENLQAEVLEGFVTGRNELPNWWVTAARIMRPALDTIWNAVGFERSLHYTSEGKRSGQIELY